MVEIVQAKKVIATAREYTVAMSLELARRALPTDDDANLKRSLELSAYFTIPKLEVAHRQLALVAAMMFAAGKNNLASALSFANRILANGGSPKMLERVGHLSPVYPPVYPSVHRSIPLSPPFFLKKHHQTPQLLQVNNYDQKRHEPSRPNANVTRPTSTRSNTTRSRTLTSAPPRTRPSTRARRPRPRRAPLTGPGITPNTRASSVACARWPRSARPLVACAWFEKFRWRVGAFCPQGVVVVVVVGACGCRMWLRWGMLVGMRGLRW